MKMVTARCFILPLDKAHFNDLIKMYLQFPEANRFIPGLNGKTSEEYHEVLLSKLDRNHDYIGFWTVLSKETNEVIGTVNLYDYPGKNIIHIGLHLHPDYWGTGVSQELMESLLDYGFNECNYNKIHAFIDEKNLHSRRLFENLGFEQEDKFLEDSDVILVYLKKKGIYN